MSLWVLKVLKKHFPSSGTPAWLCHIRITMTCSFFRGKLHQCYDEHFTLGWNTFFTCHNVMFALVKTFAIQCFKITVIFCVRTLGMSYRVQRLNKKISHISYFLRILVIVLKCSYLMVSTTVESTLWDQSVNGIIRLMRSIFLLALVQSVNQSVCWLMVSLG